MKEKTTAANIEPHQYVIFVQATKMGFYRNKTVHSILTCLGSSPEGFIQSKHTWGTSGSYFLSRLTSRYLKGVRKVRKTQWTDTELTDGRTDGQMDRQTD